MMGEKTHVSTCNVCVFLVVYLQIPWWRLVQKTALRHF